MRIAVVGGGISGLTAAYLLHGRHEIVLFEANDYVGGHTNTIDVAEGTTRIPVDTGFIVFNEKTYPNFCQLLAGLDIAAEDTLMSFSVHCERTGFEYRGADPNGLFAQRRNLVNPSFYRLLRDWLRFNREADEIIGQADDTLTVGRFLAERRFSRTFIDYYFLPMGSAVWSCPRERFEAFPIRFIAEFYRNHGMLGITTRPQWRVISGGSRQYVEPLTSKFRHAIRLKSPVRGVLRQADKVSLSLDGGKTLSFDHVIFACHSDQALRILGNDATDKENEILSSFPYEENVALLHTDTRILPARQRAWASWNYFVPAEDPGKATVTYNMNLLQSLHCRRTYCVTLNGEERIDPERVIRRIVYHHPIFDARRSKAQRRHHEILTANRTSFCGAYWGNGFHEDGVDSALSVCHAMGEKEPWKAAFTKVGLGTSDSPLANTGLATGST